MTGFGIVMRGIGRPPRASRSDRVREEQGRQEGDEGARRFVPSDPRPLPGIPTPRSATGWVPRSAIRIIRIPHIWSAPILLKDDDETDRGIPHDNPGWHGGGRLELATGERRLD